MVKGLTVLLTAMLSFAVMLLTGIVLYSIQLLNVFFNLILSLTISYHYQSDGSPW